MKNSFLKIFAYFNYNLTQQEILDPIVCVQPYIEYSIRNENSDKLKDDEEALTTPKGEKTAHLEIKFAIDYRDYFKHNTSIEKIISLKRYKIKQSPDEEYVEVQHEPVTIVLPSEGLMLAIYNLNVSKEKPQTSDDGEKENNKEMIILYTTQNIPFPDNDIPFSTIYMEFAKYMVGDWKKCNDFAFRFIVELISHSDSALKTINKQLIETDLFVLDIAKDGNRIEMLPAHSDYFHLGHPSRAVKQTRLSRIMTRIRKIFRRGNSN